MDAAFVDEPQLGHVLSELAAREPIFHRPEFGVTRADFEDMTVEDFWEVGASGRRYDRATVLDILEKRRAVPQADVWETSDFDCRRLAPNVYLLTYALLQGGARKTRRATIWQRSGGMWKIVYHQGTLIQGEAAGMPQVCLTRPPGCDRVWPI